MITPITSIFISTLTGFSVLLVLFGEQTVIDGLTSGSLCNATTDPPNPNPILTTSKVIFDGSLLLETIVAIFGTIFVVGRRMFRRPRYFARARGGLVGLLIIPVISEIIGTILWMVYMSRLPDLLRRLFPLYLWTWGIPFHGTLLIVRILTIYTAIRHLFEMDDVEDGEPLLGY